MTKTLCRRYYGKLLTGKGRNCPQTCNLYHPLKVTNQHKKNIIGNWVGVIADMN